MHHSIFSYFGIILDHSSYSGVDVHHVAWRKDHRQRDREWHLTDHHDWYHCPVAFCPVRELVSRMEQKGGGLVLFVAEIAFLVFVILVTILLVQGTRKIPVQYAKRIVGNKQYGGVRQYIPLKVNAAGVMPIIFAQAIMFLPLTLAGFANLKRYQALPVSLRISTAFLTIYPFLY